MKIFIIYNGVEYESLPFDKDRTPLAAALSLQAQMVKDYDLVFEDANGNAHYFGVEVLKQCVATFMPDE